MWESWDAVHLSLRSFLLIHCVCSFHIGIDQTLCLGWMVWHCKNNFSFQDIYISWIKMKALMLRWKTYEVNRTHRHKHQGSKVRSETPNTLKSCQNASSGQCCILTLNHRLIVCTKVYWTLGLKTNLCHSKPQDESLSEDLSVSFATLHEFVIGNNKEIWPKITP